MKLVFKGQLPENPQVLMRRLGYHVFDGAFMRRLGRDHYPRFHAHIGEKEDGVVIDVHLDMKKQSLGPRRHGPGNEELVAQERERIKQYILDLSAGQ